MDWLQTVQPLIQTNDVHLKNHLLVLPTFGDPGLESLRNICAVFHILVEKRLGALQNTAMLIPIAT
jgi:hypothetical protein